MDWLIDYYNWRIVSQYAGQFAAGLANTLIAAGASLALSVLAGIPLALARMSPRAPCWRPVAGYVQFVRATPLLVQIYLVYYAVPMLIPGAKGWSEMALGIMAMTLHHAAYERDHPRRHRVGAARPGRGRQGLRHELRPAPALRAAAGLANTLPPLLGQTAVLIKDTSLLSLITVFELVAAGVQMNSERIVPNESFLTIAAGYLLIYGVMLLLSRGVSLWLAGPAWNAR